MRVKLISTLWLALLLGGCAVATTDTVVTMPALKTNNSDTASAVDAETTNLPTTVAVLPFSNQSDSEFAYAVVRQTMYNHFASTNYRWLHWQDVDQRLQLAGIESDAALDDMSSQQLSELLGVDGLIYGEITHYNKTFAGIYAQVAVGVQLKFVSADGDVLWEVKDVQRSHAGGVSSSPVGLILNALASAKHIYGDLNLYRAADELGRDLAKDMPQPEALGQRARPTITTLVHSGVGQYLKYGDTLNIAMEGDAGLKAAAYIEGIGVIDLTETNPGEYSGSITLDKKHNVTDAAVVGRLQDAYAQTSSWVSPYGLLNVDNIPPSAVTGLQVIAQDSSVVLDWDPASATDIASYQIELSATETGPAVETRTSPDSEINLTGLSNFETTYVSVMAIDKAGNVGAPVQIPVTTSPDSRFAAASNITGDLPAVIRGVQKLSAANSPYTLRSNVRIATDGVLLVAPGVEVLVSPGARLTVLGEMHTFGDVSVKGANGQDFAEFLVVRSALPVSLKGLSITGAGIPIQIKAGAPLIEGSRFEACAFNCMTIDGTSRPVIRNSVFSGAKTSGVVVSGQAQPVFKANQFLNNEPFHLQNSSTYEIDARDNNWQPAASNMTVLGNVKF